MFESNESKAKSNRALVSVTLTGGEVMTVSVRLPLTSKLNDAVNGAEPFLDVLEGDGRQSFIAKHSIRRIELIDVPKINQMNQLRRNSDRTVFDPYTVLGVERSAGQPDIRQAYLQMVRKYHPDRFATFELPKEMTEYAAAMLVRVNLAHEHLGG